MDSMDLARQFVFYTLFMYWRSRSDGRASRRRVTEAGMYPVHTENGFRPTQESHRIPDIQANIPLIG